MDVQLLRPTDSSHHANVMMRSGGGPTPGNMGSNMPHFRKGGPTHRRHHDEGGGINPVTGDKQTPQAIAKYRGGRACHAEGDIVATPMRHGGRSHKRHRHADGGMEAMHQVSPMGRGMLGGMDGRYYAEGGKTETLRKGGRTHRHHHAEGGEESDKMRHGGRTRHHRHRHAEGDKVEMMRHGGLKKKA